ncbi:MAG: extensin family protein [Cypionkella sp.]|uniref:extensin-like domain-containing protein n=1 Tax=Cypionkella sp. TaxID=2811411 RepID=UPI002AB849EF|nr:extensin family protein [Cypionkella sp.]MDZ4309665.1 extensin family protein [Cypionkella sp.]
MRATGPITLLCVLLAGVALAEAPMSSPHPAPRPAASQTEIPPQIAQAPTATPLIRPRQRPAGFVTEAVQIAAVPAPDMAVLPASSPRPLPRPKGLGAQIEQVAAAQPDPDPAPTRKSKKKKESRKGSVCGDPSIRGQELPPVTSKTKGCGIAEPVRVTAIDGIPFSQPATIDCDTALALKRWMHEGMRPAFGNREVVQLHIFGSYMCRSRNNVRGAKVSEHGRGKAVDIAGFVFSDGKEWTIARDYNKQIRRAQKAACGIFGTTLGPGSDGYHEDHLHFDTAERRGSAYCR